MSREYGADIAHALERIAVVLEWWKERSLTREREKQEALDREERYAEAHAQAEDRRKRQLGGRT